MRKEDFERALGSLDDSLIGEIAEKDRKMIKKERKPARILRRRVWLIPAVALLLVAAILIPTLVVMNQKPEEPAAEGEDRGPGQRGEGVGQQVVDVAAAPAGDELGHLRQQ